MQQQISVITLGIADLARSRRFYGEGFGWTPVFENEEIVFYQMNGFMLGTWLQAAWKPTCDRNGLRRPGAFSLAHNVGSQDEVQPVLDRLAAAGGRILRDGDAPAAWRISRLCRRSRRPCLGDCLEPGLDDRRTGAGDVRPIGRGAGADIPANPVPPIGAPWQLTAERQHCLSLSPRT